MPRAFAVLQCCIGDTKFMKPAGSFQICLLYFIGEPIMRYLYLSPNRQQKIMCCHNTQLVQPKFVTSQHCLVLFWRHMWTTKSHEILHVGAPLIQYVLYKTRLVLKDIQSIMATVHLVICTNMQYHKKD